MAKGPAEIVLGPIFIGTVLNVAFYGIMITQVYLYFSNYKNDRLWMKIYVGLLFLADTLNSVFDLIFVYDCLIIHFADVSYLKTADWIFATDPAMTGIIAGSVQLFFAWRVKMITRNLWMTTLIIICALVDILAGVGTAVSTMFFPVFAEFHKSAPIAITWHVSAVLSDVMITSCLVWNLAKRKTGYAATDGVVKKIIKMTIQTGLLTSLATCAATVTYLARVDGTHLMFNMLLSKLYTNSLMSTLNARIGFKGVIANAIPLDVSKLASPEVYPHFKSDRMVDRPLPNPEANSDEHDLGRGCQPAGSEV